MRNLLLLLVCACCAQADIFPILSGSVTSESGASGTGIFGSGASVLFTLEQYEDTDVGQTGLRQDVYFRYSYTFSAPLGNTNSLLGASSFENLIVAVPTDCGSDAECIFGIRTQGATAAVGPIQLYTETGGTGNPGLTDPIHGIKLHSLAPATRSLTLSFFSNRIPDGNGRVYLQSGSDYLVSKAGLVITPNSHIRPQTDPEAHSPEPLSMGLFASGLFSIALLRRRRVAR